MPDELPELTRDEVGRYSRHLLLDEVGLEGQRRLKASSVICIGSGGLGSPVLTYLAAAGVGRIGVVDFDHVDASNLHRQIIHDTAAVGRPKVDSAADSLKRINPNVRVDRYDTMLTAANALEILGPYDVIVDGTDNFATRYLVNDAAVLLGKPNVYGSIFKFEGQASVFNLEGGPNYRDLYPEPPPPGVVPSCAEGGVLGILPGVIGLIQATETLKILLGKGSTLSGRLLLYDAMAMSFRELSLAPDPAAAPIERLIDYDQFCGVGVATAPQTEGVARITADRAHQQLEQGWSPFVLDVRSAAEARIVALASTDLRVGHLEVGTHAEGLPRDRDILVYCKAGARSAKAVSVLAGLGFKRLFDLEGGITAWAEQVDPSMPTY